MAGKRQTLGNNAIPSNYVLVFRPDMRKSTYTCKERISVSVKKSTRRIALNAIDIKIVKATVSKGRFVQEAKAVIDRAQERCVLEFETPVSGSCELKIDFEGLNKDTLSGFYRSRYRIGSKEHYWLTTQFEAADARRAFPCFDEPEFKATFDVSFIIDKDLSALSNMPEKGTKPMGRKKLVAFHRTPRMSTYLLYLGIGEFEKLEGSYGKIKLSVVTTPGKIGMAKTALEYGKKFMRHYEEYFGIKYPLPKMDFIAVPDFAIGGMENWGAITYAENGLLAEKGMSVMQEQRVAELVSHELAHQWFGDLVTMKWWSDIWLNESFATFMSFKAMHKVFPKWQMDVQYVLGRTGGALGADQLRSTQPIGIDVKSPADLGDAFDPNITYSKGGAILAMLEDYVGEDTFRKGLHAYLEKYAYSNATRADLWAEISRAARPNRSNIGNIASNWIKLPGYPIVEVKYNGSTLSLGQRRFFLLDRKDASIWPIPIHYLKKERGERAQEGSMLLSGKSASLKEKGLEYIKLNYAQKGFYRSKYPKSMLGELGRLIESGKISALDGYGIENDLYSAARSCSIKVSEYLDFIERHCMDCEFPMDISVSGHLTALTLLLANEKKVAERPRRLSMAYHRKLLRKLGWKRRKNDRNSTVLLRVYTLRALGFMNDKEVISRSRKLFSDYLGKGSEIDTDIRSTVYSLNAWVGDQSTFRKFVGLYEKEAVPEEKMRFLLALGSFNDPKCMGMALEYTLSKNVRMQHVNRIPASIASHEQGKEAVWKWTRSNWKRLMSMYDRGVRGLTDFIDILSVMDDRKTRKEIDAFFRVKSNYRADLARSISKSLEYIDINIRFREHNRRG
ncbi:MAG: M1 family metallopeptidase [Candidatus Micrarchaeota archaeon]|nr:M1 family metallopeptidase [Candidatus Micrarchaeota archaeon]